MSATRVLAHYRQGGRYQKTVPMEGKGCMIIL